MTQIAHSLATRLLAWLDERPPRRNGILCLIRSSQSMRGPPASDSPSSTHEAASQPSNATRTTRNSSLSDRPHHSGRELISRARQLSPSLPLQYFALARPLSLTQLPTRTIRNLFLALRPPHSVLARPLSLTELKTPRPARPLFLKLLPSLSLTSLAWRQHSLTPHTSWRSSARPLSLPRCLPFFLLLLAFFPSPAHAQLSSGNSCATAGQATLTNANPAYLLVCDGSAWRAALTYEYVSGIGGALMNMATDAGSCTTAKTGELNYNSGSPEFCTGASWVPFGSSITGTIGTAGTGLTVELAAGSAAAPSLTFHEDTTTGLFQAGNADYLYVTTGGTERAEFDGSGNFDLNNGSNTSAGGYQINGTTLLALHDKDTTGIAIGSGALPLQSATNQYNTAVGSAALGSDTGGSYNTALGNSALYSDGGGSANTAVGASALLDTTIGSDNIAVGASALYYNTGSDNTAVGTNALYYNTGSDNIAIGYDAMVGIGPHPLTATSAGNIAIGDNALTSITGGATSNVAIGYNALTKSTVSSTAPNTAIGMNAMEWATTGTNNTALGNLAMQGTSGNGLTGDYNTALGDSAGKIIQTTADDNTLLGYSAGVAITTGTDNTLLGWKAGLGVTGSHNIILGEDSSSAITSGSTNILIGISLAHVTNSSNNQLDIADLVYGTIGSAEVGINQPTPGATLDVNGTMRLDGSSSGYVGFAAPATVTGSVTYTLPAAPPGGSGYVLGSTSTGVLSWVNFDSDLDDVDIELANGSAAAPSLTFYNDTATGLYDGGTSGVLYVSTAGVERAEFDNAGNFDLDNGTETSAGGYQINGTTILALPDKDTTSIAVGKSALTAQSATASGNTALGDSALASMTNGTEATAVGYQALYKTTGSPNTALGYGAGEYITAGSNNIAIGYNAMTSTSANPLTATSAGNIAIGDNALTAITGAAAGNVALGYDALTTLSSGTDSTTIGYQSLYKTTGSPNEALGFQAGEYISSGTDNIAIGYQAMAGTSTNPLTGTSAANLGGNIAIGDFALTAITGYADGNVAIGYGALTKSTVSSTNPNTAIGYKALEYATTATNNTALGNAAMQGTSGNGLTGDYNTAIGDSALTAISTTADDNTALGYKSGYAITTGTDNTLVGYESGLGVTGSHNIILGEDPSSAITSGSTNILIGNSLAHVTNSSNNQLDIADLVYGTIGSAEVGINQPTPGATLDVNGTMRLDGSSSGYVAFVAPAAPTSVTYTLPMADASVSGYVLSSNAAGTLSWVAAGGNLNNVTVELAAGSISAPSLTFYGDTVTGLYQAASNTINFTSNSAEVAAFDTTGDFNLTNATATSAGKYQINGTTILAFPDKDTTSIAVGDGALADQNATSSGNTALGDSALASMTNGTEATAVGYQALTSATGSPNTALGYDAGEYITTGTYNIAIGTAAMASNSTNPLTATSAGNIAIGDNALTAITGGATSNVAIGYDALTKSTVSSTNPNTAIGFDALQYATTGANNTGVGNLAMQGTSGNGLTGDYNTALGDSAGKIIQTTADDNTLLGYSAGVAITTGTDNTLVGYDSGVGVTGSHNIIVGEDPSSAITSGNSNILIGNSLTGLTATSSNQLNIGNLIYGNLSSGYVGIGTTPTIQFALGASNYGLALRAGDAIDTYINGISSLDIQSGSVTMRSGQNLAWSASDDASAAPDLRIYRDATATLAQRNGTNAQTLNIYNTYTSSTSYERAELNWRTNSNVFTIQTTKGSGGGTLRNIALEPSGGDVAIGNTSPGALLDVGLAGTTLGTMRLEGSSSGYVQIQPAAAAGSWAMTLPSAAPGANGFVLSGTSAGVTSWVSPASSLNGATIELGAGSAAAPSLTFQEDTTTGLWQAAIDTLNVSTAGAEVAAFDSTGDFNLTNAAATSTGNIRSTAPRYSCCPTRTRPASRSANPH